MVFLDDNPFERELVRTMLPEVTVPELPEDPAEATRALNYIRSQPNITVEEVNIHG